MPIYEYHCRFCKKTIERVHKVTRIPKRVRCECGHAARKVLSKTAIHCDGIADVKWLESAKQNLPNDARHIETRSEHKKYLKENNLACIG